MKQWLMASVIAFGVSNAYAFTPNNFHYVDGNIQTIRTVQRSGSSFRSSSSSMRSSPPSYSIQRSSPPSSSGGSTSSVQRSSPPISTPVLPRSTVETNVSRGQSAASLNAFKSEQSRFKQPPIAAPQSKTEAASSPAWRQYGTRWNSSNDYFAARTLYVSMQPPPVRMYYTNPPIYVRNIRPAYGTWSGVFLGSLLAVGVADSYYHWAYAHRYDPSYRAWHSDMMAQAENDSEARERLANLDSRVSRLEEDHAVVDENQLPDGVDPSLAIAPETVMLATSGDDSSPLGWAGTIIGSVIGICLLAFLIKKVFIRNRFA